MFIEPTSTLICGAGIILIVGILSRLRRWVYWSVECWFCSSRCKVPFHVRNSWLCPDCEQYNGFTKDGDYNRDIDTISERSDASPPRVMDRQSVRFATPSQGTAWRDGSMAASNGLCQECNNNQAAKIRMLKDFEPRSHDHRAADQEYEVFKKELEITYGLCPNCEEFLREELRDKHQRLINGDVLNTYFGSRNTAEQSGGVEGSPANNTTQRLTGLAFEERDRDSGISVATSLTNRRPFTDARTQPWIETQIERLSIHPSSLPPASPWDTPRSPPPPSPWDTPRSPPPFVSPLTPEKVRYRRPRTFSDEQEEPFLNSYPSTRQARSVPPLYSPPRPTLCQVLVCSLLLLNLISVLFLCVLVLTMSGSFPSRFRNLFHGGLAPPQEVEL